MSMREARYYAAVALAHEILAGPVEEDGRRLAEAVAVLTGEVVAGRKNQQEFPAIAARVLTQPSLRVVRED